MPCVVGPRQDWGTPQKLYDKLNAEFGFTLDSCAHAGNAKCSRYFTAETDGLAQDWSGEVAFMNPPYDNIAPWVKRRSARTPWS